MLLRHAYEQVREFVTIELNRNGYYQTLDGRTLSQCSLAELQNALSDICSVKKENCLLIA